MTRNRVRIFPIVAAIFLIVPILEIYLLIQIGSVIGALPTIGLVVLTAVIGVALLRVQGFVTYARFNQALGEGRVPAKEIMEGVALLVGGALLLTPGFFTDAIGFLCLLPISRRTMVEHIAKRFGPISSMNMRGTHTHRSQGNVYEGKVTGYHEE